MSAGTKGFCAVFEREILERRVLLLGGVVGLIPLALPFLPGAAGGDAQDLRASSAVALALVLSAALALLLGGTVIGTELSQNRLGFYFSHPLPGWAIWSGKLAAAFALSLATVVLVLLPAVLVDGLRPWRGLAGALPVLRFSASALSASQPLENGIGWLAAGWLAAILVIILIAHAVGVMARSRSPLLGLDILALCLGAWLVRLAALQLLSAGAVDAFALMCAGLAGAGVAAVALAGAMQVARGRTDLRRGHRLLSATLWGVLLTLALAAQVYARWVAGATPAELTAFTWVAPAPQGSWATVVGPAAHRAGFAPRFLVDAASQRFVALSPLGAGQARFSAAGRRVAFVASDDRTGESPVFTVDLAAAEARPVRSRFSFPRLPVDFALSPDGGRVAGIAAGRLLAADLASGRLLAAVPVDPATVVYSGLLFTDPSHLRLYRQEVSTGTTGTRILELDLATGKLAPTGWFSGSTFPLFDLSLDLRRLIVADAPAGAGGERVARQAVDARTGERLLDFPAAATVRCLLGGRYAELRHGASGGRATALVIRDAGGGELRRLDLPAPRFVRLGGQPDADRLVYAVSADQKSWTSYLFDLQSGTARLLGPRLLPLAAPAVGQTAPADLFVRGGVELVRIDFAAGGARVVLRAGGEREGAGS